MPDTGEWVNEYPYDVTTSSKMINSITINANSYYDFTVEVRSDLIYNNYPHIDIEQGSNFNVNLIPMYIRREHTNSLPGLNVPGYIYHFRIYNFTSSNQVTGDNLVVCIKEYPRGSAV